MSYWFFHESDNNKETKIIFKLQLLRAYFLHHDCNYIYCTNHKLFFHNFISTHYSPMETIWPTFIQSWVWIMSLWANIWSNWILTTTETKWWNNNPVRKYRRAEVNKVKKTCRLKVSILYNYRTTLLHSMQEAVDEMYRTT